MTIRVGLIGFGLSGRVFHAPFIDTVPGLELSAVVSSRSEAVHQYYPDVAVIATAAELFTRSDIDLVVITTPNQTHFELAKEAILHDKSVVVEKPFTVSSVEADELIALAKTRNVTLSVYQNRRWDGDFLTIQDVLASGALGEVAQFESHFDRFRPVVQDRWRERAVPGAGTLYDLGSHLIDQALCLFGPPQAVFADLARQRSGSQAIDYVHLVLHCEQKRVILHSSSLAQQSGPRFAIHGSQGSFVKYGLDPQEAALRSGIRPDAPNWGMDEASQYGRMTTQQGELKFDGHVQTLPGRYQAFYEGMAAALASGANPPVRAEEARDVIRVIECALTSAGEGKVVRFAE